MKSEPVSPPVQRAAGVVGRPRFPDSHDPFWPRMELSSLRERLRLDQGVSEARLEVAVCCAAIAAASEFARWRAALRELGFKRLEDVSGHANGRALSVCYRRFVEAAVLRNLHMQPNRARSSGEARA